MRQHISPLPFAAALLALATARVPGQGLTKDVERQLLAVREGQRWVTPFWHLEPFAVRNGREIPLPDTLGANFAIGDSTAKAGTPEDYDALVGFWEFRFQNRNANGTFSPAFSGHWSFEKK